MHGNGIDQSQTLHSLHLSSLHLHTLALYTHPLPSLLPHPPQSSLKARGNTTLPKCLAPYNHPSHTPRAPKYKPIPAPIIARQNILILRPRHKPDMRQPIRRHPLDPRPQMLRIRATIFPPAELALHQPVKVCGRAGDLRVVVHAVMPQGLVIPVGPLPAADDDGAVGSRIHVVDAAGPEADVVGRA